MARPAPRSAEIVGGRARIGMWLRCVAPIARYGLKRGYPYRAAALRWVGRQRPYVVVEGLRASFNPFCFEPYPAEDLCDDPTCGAPSILHLEDPDDHVDRERLEAVGRGELLLLPEEQRDAARAQVLRLRSLLPRYTFGSDLPTPVDEPEAFAALLGPEPGPPAVATDAEPFAVVRETYALERDERRLRELLLEHGDHDAPRCDQFDRVGRRAGDPCTCGCGRLKVPLETGKPVPLDDGVLVG
jgi:hypothetical protein